MKGIEIVAGEAGCNRFPASIFSKDRILNIRPLNTLERNKNLQNPLSK